MSETFTVGRRLPPLPALVLRTAYAIAPKVDLWLGPVVQLGLRFWMANLFFKSGMTKINDWETTKALFEIEYQVPWLSPEFAAQLATGFELTLPVLLVLGLFTRLAALPLLGMVMVIQFVLGASNDAFNNPVHYYWMMLLLVLVARGGGTLSLDFAIGRYLSSGRRRVRKIPT